MEGDVEASQDRERLAVCSTFDREFAREYIAQLNQQTLATLGDVDEGDFLLIRNLEPLETELHTRVRLNSDIPDDSIGLDFTLRTALGVPSEREVDYGDAEVVNQVEIEPVGNAEDQLRQRALNKALGVRPQVCRVRMGVFPDLEDKVCRLPRNTMELLGIEEGENVTVESTRGQRIVRGLKAFEINEEREEKKERQKERDGERYLSCEDLLELNRIRHTEVDIPEIWLDEEARQRLGLQELCKNGVCQPVRVYRDTGFLLKRSLYQFAIPLVIVLVATGLEVEDVGLAVLLWGLSVVVWFAALLVGSRGRLN